ncbi:DNA repair protein RecO C-terminal domain-containing protein, partial [Nocardia cyriacigeorgica]|uniref:DNA repair protein RecO C-terminal domain-containing protein n=1 Tax=Nocardia cyriacigeorgica TaxID=135487 RepID=UPI002456C307
AGHHAPGCPTPAPPPPSPGGGGGGVGVHCRPPGAATPGPGVLDLMVALHRGEWDFVDTVPDATRRQASGLIAAHLQWHLERQLRTLPLIERSRPANDAALAGSADRVG